jgi:hypothetical protein
LGVILRIIVNEGLGASAGIDVTSQLDNFFFTLASIVYRENRIMSALTIGAGVIQENRAR